MSKRRHNVYISDKTNEILVRYVPDKFANKSVFIDLCIRTYYEHECELTYYKNYLFMLKEECEQVGKKILDKTVIL